MQQEIIISVISAGVSILIGIIAYFLKRTMSQGDKNSADIQCLRESCVNKEDFRELKEDISDLNDKYATKEEVREIKDGMKKITSDIEYVKEKTVGKDDFIRTMTRLENKVDQLIDRR